MTRSADIPNEVRHGATEIAEELGNVFGMLRLCAKYIDEGNETFAIEMALGAQRRLEAIQNVSVKLQIELSRWIS